MRRPATHCLLTLALLLLGGLPASAQTRTVFLAPTAAGPGLEDLAAGYDLWLARRIEAAGLGSETGDAVADLSVAFEQAASRSAAYAVVPDLQRRRGNVELRLRLYQPASQELLGVFRAETPVEKLGEACEETAGRLLRAAGVPDEQLPAQPPPLLDELASTGRARLWVARGELTRAWREVQGKLSPTPMRLRNAIVEAARERATPLAERARVMAATGDPVGAWSLIAAEVARQARQPRSERRLLLAAAEVQLARNNPRGAREHLERLLAQDPQDAEAQLDLGLALDLQKDRPEARRALELAAQLDPGNPRPLALLEELEVETPERRAKTLLRLGELETERWNERRAQRLFARATREDTAAESAAWRGQARLHERWGRPARALAAWDHAAETGAEDAELWLGRARAQRELGDERAQASFERAIALEPGRPDVLTELGRMEVEFGRAELAVPVLRSALEHDPQDAESRRALAQALRAVGEPGEALEVLAATDAESVETLRELAATQRALGELEAARTSLEHAVSLDPYHAEVHQDLAGLLEQAGDGSGAARERALASLLEGDELGAEPGSERRAAPAAVNLDEFVMSFASQISDSNGRRVVHLGLRETGGWKKLLLHWLEPRLPDLAGLETSLVQALALRFQVVSAEDADSPLFRERVDPLYAFDEPSSLDARRIADVNLLLDTDSVFVARLLRPVPGEKPSSDCIARGGFELQMRMLSGQDPSVASILSDGECVAGGLAAHGTWNHRALSIYGLLGLFVLFPMLRGWGTCIVEIKLPPRTRGFLRIHIAKTPQEVGQEKVRKKDTGGRMRRSLRSFSRFHKHMAGRETVFRWLPARKRAYYVTVSGPLMDAMGDEVIGNFLEEQRVRIVRRKPARLTYDFNPDECAVQVNVLWEGEPARNARVVLRDNPDSLRYAREGSAFFYLGKGNHTIVAGNLDRATERTLKIESIGNAIPLSIDLGDEASCMVRNCSEAVEPYLMGDFAAAAVALQVAGEDQLAHLMQGAHYQQIGDNERAASEFEAAGCIDVAAELRASGADYQGSAALFEQAGEHARAAEVHREAGNLEAAARCYEAAYDYQNALECYSEAGVGEKVLELYEKTGAYLDAAELAHEQGSFDRALENLRNVERRDPAYGEAARLSAEILSQQGEYAPAAEKMAEAIESAGGENAPVEMHQRLAEILDAAALKPEALEAYQTVVRRDPRRPEVTQRIAALRQEIADAAPSGEPQTVRSAPTESRYEILGELGRGGMGVVLEARDKRLGRIVALKRLPDNLRDNGTAAQLFLREARAAAALNHPNIVTVYDAGEENGIYHITMELLEGLPLNVIQDRRGSIGTRDAARLGVQVCAGLQYAHERRIVHRDIKTANLFFTRDRVVKIMDFGLAKTIEEVRKNSTVIGGTPYYMAPEQAAGEAVDNRTDLYALGVTLFRLQTGTFPFREGDLAYHHRHTEPPDPRDVAQDMPDAMAELILELLAKAPEARPADAAAVGLRLQALCKAPDSD